MYVMQHREAASYLHSSSRTALVHACSGDALLCFTVYVGPSTQQECAAIDSSVAVGWVAATATCESGCSGVHVTILDAEAGQHAVAMHR